MKTTIKIFATVLAAILCLSACVKSQEFETAVIKNEPTLLEPAEGTSVTLTQTTTKTVDFKWNVPPKEDGAIKYKLAFYAAAEGGEPIYTVTAAHFILSESKLPEMSVDYKTLNEVASIAGIQPGQKGTIYWSVVFVKGLAEKAAKPRSLSVTRYEEFDDIPYSVYMAGEAVGNTVVPMLSIGEGQFQVLADLKGGSPFQFSNAANGTGRTFGLKDDTLAEGAKMTVDGPTGPYRVTVDFNALTVKMEAITKMEHISHSAYPYVRTELNYLGNGVWESGEITVPANSGNGRYYKFLMTIDGEEHQLGTNSTSGGSEFTSLAPQALYEQVVALADNNQYTFRYWGNLANCPVKFTLNFGKGDNSFIITPKYSAPKAVTEILLPTEEEIKLVNPNTNVAFSWTNPTYDAGTPACNYSVVFYSDAACEDELGTSGTTTGSSVNVNMGTLDGFADKALIPATEAGTLYWKVKSNVCGNEVISNVKGTLNIKRIPADPTVLYIYGEGTEYGADKANAVKFTPYMHVLKDNVYEQYPGQYEIICQIEGGKKVYFSEGTSADARTYAASGSSIVLSDNGFTKFNSGLYRIRINMNDWTVTFDQIATISWGYADTSFDIVLPYRGHGVWATEKYAGSFGTNKRVFIKAFMAEASNYEKIGGPKGDPSNPSGDPVALKNDSRYYAFWKPGNYDSWSDGWKINTSASEASIFLDMKPENEHARFYISFKGVSSDYGNEGILWK